MKSILTFFAAFCMVQASFGQSNEVYNDAEGNKVVKGFLSKKDLVTDSAFAKWYSDNTKGYTPDQNALQALRANKDSIYVLAFGGTWCHDTHFVIPRFYALADAAGLSQDHITLVGVGHDKKTVQHLSETFNITNVPTLIVLRNGKEVGRVIEYGKKGMFDRELGEIVAASAKK